MPHDNDYAMFFRDDERLDAIFATLKSIVDDIVVVWHSFKIACMQRQENG